MSRNEFDRLIEALKAAAAALREAQVPFMLDGSLAAWARGGPEPEKDVDLIVKPEDAEAALAALAAAGMKTSRPPEEWLYKAWHEDVLIDLIFRPSGLEITDEVLARAQPLSVMAVSMPVMAVEDTFVTMLLAIDEHTLDYTRPLAIARSLREQIDWPQLRSRTSGSPFARAFFTLVEGLEIAPPARHTTHRPSSRVRVLRGGEAD